MTSSHPAHPILTTTHLMCCFDPCCVNGCFTGDSRTDTPSWWLLHLCPSHVVLPTWQPALVSIRSSTFMTCEPAGGVRGQQSTECSVYASVDWDLRHGALCSKSAPVSSPASRLLCQFLNGVTSPETGPQGKCIYLMLIGLCYSRATDVVVVTTRVFSHSVRCIKRLSLIYRQ